MANLENLVQRIALLKPSALGDIAHALPVLSALRRRFPVSHLTWIVNRSFEPLLAGHPHLDATLAFDRGAFRKLRSALHYSWQFAESLRKQRFDLVIDLQGLLRTGLMCAASGAPRRIGFTNAREGAPRFYTERIAVPDADRIHAVDRYWRIAEHLGCNGPLEFHLPVNEAERDAVHAAMKGLPRPWYSVAVGAKWLTKRWPPESFGTLLAGAQREFGGTAIFLGTAEDTADSLRAAAMLPGPWKDFTNRTSLPRLAATLAASDAMIANDTGPLHLAAALGVPCVAPYTCTKTVLHGPYGQNGGVETTVACGGSYVKKCPHGSICFDELSPARLQPALQRVMTSWPLRQSA